MSDRTFDGKVVLVTGGSSESFPAGFADRAGFS
jgi:hypothetical protein